MFETRDVNAHRTAGTELELFKSNDKRFVWVSVHFFGIETKITRNKQIKTHDKLMKHDVNFQGHFDDGSRQVLQGF